MPTTGKTAADYTCRACGQQGHTQRSSSCPARAGGGATSSGEVPAKRARKAKASPAPKRAARVRQVVEQMEAIGGGDIREGVRRFNAAGPPSAIGVARKLRWAIEGAVAGHLTLEQLGAIGRGADVAAACGE